MSATSPVGCRLQINESGRCTVPKPVRLAFGLEEGDSLQIEIPFDPETYREIGWDAPTYITTITIKHKYRFTISSDDLDALGINETESREARWKCIR